MIRWTLVWLAAAVATGANAQTAATDARPQTLAPGAKAEPSPAPPRRASKEPPQKLLLTVSLFGGGADEVNTSDALRNGMHADADAMLTYERRVGRAVIAANGRSVIREDARATPTPMGQQGNLDFSFVTRRQQFHASQGIGYSPYFEFGGLQQRDATPLGQAAASHGDFATGDLSSITSTTAVGWSRTISQRFTFSAAYDLRRSVFGRSALNMKSQSAGARLTQRLTRYVSLRTGYTYRDSDATFVQPGRPRVHDLDVGLDYARPVSLSRRTTLQFASGSALTPYTGGLAFNFTGNATLTRQIGRTWQARVGATRDVQLLEGFADPVLANAVTASVTGAVRRRVTFSSSLAVSRGSVGIVTVGNEYTNWTGGAGLSFALGRRVALETQFFVAGYQFDGNFAVAPGLTSRRQQRQGMRIGLTWRAPLLGH